ncbi:MAG: hypothetical protein JOZ57_08160 [Abitibacteriaceae bacterium]|nr:hypothetical protein [Abditibacteriaceae bacterium]
MRLTELDQFHLLSFCGLLHPRANVVGGWTDDIISYPTMDVALRLRHSQQRYQQNSQSIAVPD